jgi:uncharacterized membrane protein
LFQTTIMHGLYLVSVWLHILAAIVWIGGTIFLALVLLPVLRTDEHAKVAPALIRASALRFRTIGWHCFAIFIVTGSLNLMFRGVGFADLGDGDFWRGSFGSLLALKLGLVCVIIAISAIHDFVIGPRAAAAWQDPARTKDAVRLRRQAVHIARLNLFLALVAVALGTMLVRGAP